MIGQICDRIIGFFYRRVLKPVFFIQDPEVVHDRMVAVGRMLGSNYITRVFTGLIFGYRNRSLEQDIAGIHFKNPIGLAAGFDKNAQLMQILPSVGFGFEEIGSITGEPCPGNPKPRLWRLKQSQSLLVYYGLKNDGAEAIVKRIKDFQPKGNHPSGKRFKIPIGVSIAKTNNQETVDEQKGIADYVKAYKAFVAAGVGDYFTINISCPNTFGGEPFTTPEKFERLMAAISLVPSQKPIFIKMPAEMAEEVIDQIIVIAKKFKVAGFVSTNLAKNRANPNIKDSAFPATGGMSGKVVGDLSDKQISYIYRKTRGEFVIIGCGGVFSAADAYRKIKLGASLIQLITGMVYQGPQVIGEINRDLAELVAKDGYSNISQAVGRGN